MNGYSELDQYDFPLPSELIAQSPLPSREDAKLLVLNRANQSISHTQVREFVQLLKPSDTLVVNNTKVVPARLVGSRTKSGGYWEGLFLQVLPGNRWKIMCKTRGKLQAGETISLSALDGSPGFSLELEEKDESDDVGCWIVRPRTDLETFTAIEKVGRVPIPPYIREGKMIESDKKDYQTVFASEPGAVAAPTAGLHFTDTLLAEIEKIGVAVLSVTLHVGIGTFRPISATKLAEHKMHSEWCDLSAETAEKINSRRSAGGRTIAIGTTSVRVLETAASETGTLQKFQGETNLFIRPPYKFKAVDVLFTNFHFPKSTLYILVRTFGCDELVKAAYEEAVREKYRFFSYGDAMVVF